MIVIKTIIAPIVAPGPPYAKAGGMDAEIIASKKMKKFFVSVLILIAKINC